MGNEERVVSMGEAGLVLERAICLKFSLTMAGGGHERYRVRPARQASALTTEGTSYDVGHPVQLLPSADARYSTAQALTVEGDETLPGLACDPKNH